MSVVKWRSLDPRLAPRRTKLPVPGWGGEDVPRADGALEQPWHCIPFTEAATGGIELLFPYDVELHVHGREDGPAFETVGAGGEEPPFRRFGAPYYTWQCLLDLRVEDGFAVKVETHPRFYTDTTGSVPVAVPALIRPWWPMIYFAVFKTPPRGQTHIFRPGEPFIQFSVVSPDDKPDLVAMDEAEAAERAVQAERIYTSRKTLGADSEWTSATDTVFDGTYRRLYGAARSAKR